MNALKSVTLRQASLVLLLTAFFASSAFAGPREQAKRIHDRLVGVPPTAQTLDAMEALVAGGDPVAAAFMAMDHPLFYNSTLKNWVTPWTNEAQTVFDELNDYSATVIGIIRDERDFRQVLSEDLVYVGAAGVVNSAYSHTDNDHYRELEDSRADLSDPAVLVPVAQSSLAGTQLNAADTAGVLTTRAAARSFLSGGTNRRQWRFLGYNYLCRDMEPLNDISRPSHRLRQDVSRSPGGDSQIFHNNCVGCHSGMDALTGAFAYLEWDEENERLIHTPGQVQGKYLINPDTFPGGFVTFDNSWQNLWRIGPNSYLGWRGDLSAGFGPKALGQEVANSEMFSECQVEKVFEKVCLHPVASPQERAEVQRIAGVLEAQGYNMKRAFAEVAAYCRGQ